MVGWENLPRQGSQEPNEREALSLQMLQEYPVMINRINRINQPIHLSIHRSMRPCIDRIHPSMHSSIMHPSIDGIRARANLARLRILATVYDTLVGTCGISDMFHAAIIRSKVSREIPLKPLASTLMRSANNRRTCSAIHRWHQSFVGRASGIHHGVECILERVIEAHRNQPHANE